MKIYWSLRDVPELAPLSPAERIRIHEACLNRHFFKAQVTRTSLTAFIVMLILCPVALVALMTWMIQIFGGTTPLWLIFLTMVVGATLGRFVFSRIAVAHLRQFYSEYIQKKA
jgi:hypothetical protein